MKRTVAKNVVASTSQNKVTGDLLMFVTHMLLQVENKTIVIPNIATPEGHFKLAVDEREDGIEFKLVFDD